jgi:hypothetical protein
LLPNIDLLDRGQYRDFVAGASTEAILVGFRPDILGERMILNRLKPSPGDDGVARKLPKAAWHIQPDDVCDFILRVADDFPGDQEIVTLCDLPGESAAARFKRGWLVGDLIRVVNRSDDPGTGKTFQFNDVDMAADNPIPITPRLLGSAHAEIAEEVQDVVLTDQAVQVREDCLVHLPGRVKRPIAIANDILMPEMKVSGKPRVNH